METEFANSKGLLTQTLMKNLQTSLKHKNNSLPAGSEKIQVLKIY